MDSDQRAQSFTIPDEITHDLKKPFKKVASDDTMTRVSFRPPTVGEMKQVEKKAAASGEAAGGIFMLSLLSNDKLTEPDIERMNFLDMQICVEKLQPFLKLAEVSAK